MGKKKFFLFFSFLLILSCELKHSNPLDPVGNDVTVPSIVTGIELMLYTNEANQIFIEVKWSDEGNAQIAQYNYNIYRGLSYYGVYEKVKSQSNSPFNDYDIISGNRYYYKMSAVNQEGLEGPFSSPTAVQVN